MNNIQAPRVRKKEVCLKFLFETESEQQDIQSILLNIKHKTRRTNGENMKAALDMYYESLKVKRWEITTA